MECRLVCNYVATSVSCHCSIVVSVSGYEHRYRYILSIIKAYLTRDLLRIKLRTRHVRQRDIKGVTYDLSKRVRSSVSLICHAILLRFKEASFNFPARRQEM